ncbi:short chain dehydrogenase reductase family [Colletotrichum incanum]|uniref:Short chain dehydrogenase reductase family n=1 Tax=Colletotrichum incanum TaxID=1573173 RepID=A0A161WIU9_COLIC|nr:short chain dehydrogenase reductase family [Colletotrichum incanum]
MTTGFSNAFAGKVIAVTGAASGIGRAVALYLGERGASLALSDVQKEELENVAADIVATFPHAKAVASVVDVRNSNAVNEWISSTVKTFGHLDGAANIAGTGGNSSQMPLESQEDEDWDFVVSINSTGVMICLREELKVLSDGGSIVNASSVLGLRSGFSTGMSAYTASKHGVMGLTKMAAREYGHKNIRINSINPGAITTPMMPGDISDYADESGGVMPPIFRMGKPEEVAALVAFLLGDESKYITGTSMVIDGGYLS